MAAFSATIAAAKAAGVTGSIDPEDIDFSSGYGSGFRPRFAGGLGGAGSGLDLSGSTGSGMAFTAACTACR